MYNFIHSIIIKENITYFLNNFHKKNLEYHLNHETGLLDLTYLKHSFDTKVFKINNISFPSNLKIKILKFYFNTSKAFVFVQLNKSYPLSDMNITSKSQDLLCFILSQTSKYNWIIDYIISREHNPTLYNKVFTNTFNFNELKQNISKNLDIYSKLEFISKPRSYKKIIFSPRSHEFDFKKSLEYAETYALSYNTEYKSFQDTGGDCTNFASQTLHYGGIKKNSTWYPYSNPWVRVNELRNYLINNNLAKEYFELDDNMSGALIQFFHRDKKTWTHSGILTYQRGDDYLYCCHSYDKLNYPLSLAYPSIYPKIRIIVPF